MAHSNNSIDPVYSYLKAIMLLIVYLASLYESQAQHLVKDLNSEPQSSWVDSKAVQVGSVFYFSAYSNRSGVELWKSDGTANGTVMVKDIFVGSNDGYPKQLNALNGKLYFIANDGEHGNELWTSDGTVEGTYLFKEFRDGGNGAVVLSTAVANGYLFITILENNKSYLWATNGTETHLLIDMGSILELTSGGNAVYFSGDGSGDQELWRSEGTEETTGIVKDITGNNVNTNPTKLTNVNGTIYFSAYTTAFGVELWKTDGTDAGTVLTSNLASGSANSDPDKLTASGNKLYFTANNGAQGRELWVNEDNSMMFVKDISANTASTEFGEMIGVDGSLYFTAATSLGRELWKTDGSGTAMIKDIASGATSSNPTRLTLVNSTVYFTAFDEEYGQELWKTDGSANGTIRVADIREGMENGNPASLFSFQNDLYFWADDSSSGWELWTSKASGETLLLKDIAKGSVYSEITSAIGDDHNLWFTDYYTGVWRTDGSEAGTTNIRPMFDSQYSKFLRTTDWLYLVNRDNETNQESILMSDGIHEPLPLHTTGFKQIGWLKDVNGTLYFAADKEGSGMELWKSNGNFDDITMVLDIYPGAIGSSPAEPFEYNGALYFRAYDATHGWELWKCEGGTALSTKIVKDISTGSPHGNPHDFVVANGKIFFSATDDEHGQELWLSDGSEEGTHIVADIWPGSNYSNPSGLTVLNDVVYFVGQAPNSGYELWRSNGTEEGTYLVKDINAGSGSAQPGYLTAASNFLYFSADDNDHGIELWKSDGTEGGTRLVKDITPGEDGSGLYGLTAVNGQLAFIEGYAVWRSSGTECSTVPAFDDSIVAFDAAFAPVASGNKLYFVGISEMSGAELYYYEMPNAEESRCAQEITFTKVEPRRLGDANFKLHATSSSGLPVTFSVPDNSIVTIDGDNVTIKAAGEVVITATQEGDTEYAMSTATQNVVISRRQQTITFSELPDRIYGEEPFTLNATASSQLPVSYGSSDDEIVSIQGNTVTITGAGEVSITAKQDGNAEYDAATPVTQMLIVTMVTGLENDPDKLVTVYPNPATDVVVVDGSILREGALVALMDINGRIISSTEKDMRLDVSGLSSGIYIVRITTTDFSVSKRIVKK